MDEQTARMIQQLKSNPAMLQSLMQSQDGQALFEWDNSSRTGNASPRDHALLVVYHKQLQQAVYETTGSQRADGLATLNYPTNWQPDDLAVYLGFWSRTEKIASNSLCLWG